MGLAAVLAAIWAARIRAGEQLAVDYLRRRGVPARIHLTRLDVGGVEGSVTLGSPTAPTLIVPHFRADLDPLSGLRAPRVTLLTLNKPVLRIAWDGRRLRLGALQPLFDEALRAPRSGKAGPAPRLEISGGRLGLDMPFGHLNAILDVASRAGGLQRASLRLPPSRLALPAGEVRGFAGDLMLRADARGGYEADLALAASSLSVHESNIDGIAATVHAHLPGGAAAPALAGLVQAVWRLEAAKAAAAGWTASTPRLAGELSGTLGRGGLSFVGRASAQADAGETTAAGAALNAPHVSAALSRVSLAADAMDADFRIEAAAPSGQVAAQGERFGLEGLRTASQGRLKAAPHAPLTLMVEASLDAAGGLARHRAAVLSRRWAGALGADLRPALEAALTRSTLAVPKAQVSFDGRSWRGRLNDPAAVEGGGARLTLAAPGGWIASAAAVDAPRLSVALAGAGVPRATLDASAIHISSGRSHAAVRLDASGSAGAFRDATLALRGDVGADASGVRLALATCAAIRLGRYLGDDGKVLARAITADVCPSGAERLFGMARGGGWRAAARVGGLALAAPEAQLALAGGEAEAALRSDRGAVRGDIRIGGAQLSDLTRPLRFRPLWLAGPLRLADHRLAGTLDVRLVRPDMPLGRVAVDQDLAAGTTELIFKAKDLRFAPKGLQPASVLPALATLGQDVTGGADVDFRLGLSGGKIATRVHVTISGLQLKTAAGLATGLQTDLTLTDLDPLASPPDQRVSAERLAGVVPLTGLEARFQLGGQALNLASVRAELAGGVVTLDPMRIDLRPGGDMAGAVRVVGVQLGVLLGSLNLSKAVTVDARLNGVLPFSFGPSGLRLGEGRLAAEGPGRLSVNRNAISGAATQGASAEAPPSAVQDFAFKSLEDLEFSELDASVVSRPQGRLGVVFHVRGRHEPPIGESDRIDLLALLRGHAFDRRIPLPKGTEVNLTLDTSLNLDDLLAAFPGLSAAPGSAQVQPQDARP